MGPPPAGIVVSIGRVAGHLALGICKAYATSCHTHRGGQTDVSLELIYDIIISSMIKRKAGKVTGLRCWPKG